MSKYSISNCPAMTDQGCCFQGSVLLGTAYKDCDERTDCLLKRIVEMCKPQKVFCDSCEGNPLIDCIDCTQGGKAIMANAVLEMLKIQEVEE